MSRTYKFRSLLIFIIVLVTAFTVSAEDFSTWLKRMPITFSGYDKEETLINFPALIVLEETDAGIGFHYSDFLSPPYDDLRFVAEDKSTPLDFEVESWNLNGKSYVWVKVPELLSSTTIYVLWCKEGAVLQHATHIDKFGR